MSSCKFLLLTLLSFGLTPVLLAHEGHDHEEEAAPAAAAPGAAPRPVIELTSDLYEALVVNHGDHLDIYLDRYDSNEPVTGAKIFVEIESQPAVDAIEVTPAQYMVPIKVLEAGKDWPISLSIKAAPGDDLLDGTFKIPAPVHESLTHRLGHWAEAAWPWLLAAILSAGALVVLRRRRERSRFALPVLLALSANLLLPETNVTAHEGHDHEEEAAPAAPVGGAMGERPARLSDGSLFVPKATQRIIELRTQIATSGPTAFALRLAGEIVGDPNASATLQTLQGGRVAGVSGRWPLLGARVRRGEALLRLTPSGSASERAGTAADAAQVRAELAQARAELARLEGLAGVVARVEIDTARTRVQSLVARQSALGAPSGGGELITSPIDGVIASIDAQPGNVAQPGESLVTVIDPARLSVEALAFEPIPGGMSGIKAASVALRDGTRIEAKLQGIGAQTKGGAVPVRLNLTSVPAPLTVGQPVVVYLERTVTAAGLPLPLAALVRTPNGERVVYQKMAAERYMPRPVRVRQISADQIAVVAGLEADARVVISGAALLAQIR